MFNGEVLGDEISSEFTPRQVARETLGKKHTFTLFGRPRVLKSEVDSEHLSIGTFRWASASTPRICRVTCVPPLPVWTT